MLYFFATGEMKIWLVAKWELRCLSEASEIAHNPVAQDF